MLQHEPDRIGILIRRRGTWRETVAHYGAYKGLAQECVVHFDALVEDGWIEAWAALRALDDHCCADIIVSNETVPVDKTVN